MSHGVRACDGVVQWLVSVSPGSWHWSRDLTPWSLVTHDTDQSWAEFYCAVSRTGDHWEITVTDHRLVHLWQRYCYQDTKTLSHNSALLADIYWPLVTRMWEPENTSDWLLFDLAIDQQDFNLLQYQLHPSVLGTQLFNHDSPNNFTVNHLILNWTNVTLMRMSVMMFTSSIHRKY